MKVLPSEGVSLSLDLTTPSPSGSPDGSAVFRGCFRRPDNLSLALPMTAAMPNMSVDRCVDLCTEKVSLGSYSWKSVWNRMLGWRSGSPEGMWEVITIIHDMGEGYACLVWIQGMGVTQGRVLSL